MKQRYYNSTVQLNAPASHRVVSYESTRNQPRQLQSTHDTTVFNILLLIQREWQQMEINLTCQSKERADVSTLKSIAKRLNGPTNGRKDHYQVANSVPCLIRADETLNPHECNTKVRGLFLLHNLTTAALFSKRQHKLYWQPHRIEKLVS